MTDASSPSVARVALTALTLTDFRNYAHLALKLDGRSVVLVGANGSGKTNLLEAVSFLSPGRGLRRAPYDTVARSGGSGGWTVHAELETASGPVAIGTGIAPDAGGPRSRRIRIDGEDASSSDALLSHLDVVWLTPAMDGLFTGPAGDRRRFLDRLVMGLDPAHGRNATRYEKAVRHRNRLLEDPGADAGWFDAIETEIAQHGAAIAAARADLVARFRNAIDAIPPDASAFPRAHLALDGDFEARTDGADAQERAETFRRLLSEGRPRDRAAGRTLTGPHRADLVVTHADKAMPAAQASTGEQKALLIGLILAHAELIADANRRAPVLLLDEVAAHLDPNRRAALYDRLERLGGQIFMTGTDPILFEAIGERAEIFHVADGRLAPGA
ncbi:DNA replication/repair protein RecF [Amorphus orientalis]|uniref:DNA replication and repair protein RecF n=1 Tax=Amorphus orientalis TaxID=649198 RepID=A0AAE3VLY0_9HYPH|nr:DNA replication/repair protein RecF [Amorphus orientalis]MDQ0314170.1 DNA replication and repair protein RecF [Amorphus orientalis]